MSDFSLRPPSGSHKKKRIVGRGASARRGATAGKGDKGQNARSGGGVSPGFEGGQMPLFRRIARRGFNNKRFASEYEVVNVGDIASKFTDGETVNKESLVAKRLIKKSVQKVKLLGNGDIDIKLTVDVDAVSESARTKITSAGGTFVTEDKV